MPVSRIMRKVLTAYAVSFNKRYNRHGHLFQNRYKSILCEEEAYLKELVAVGKEDLKSGSKVPTVSRARSVLCYLAVRELGIAGSVISKQLGISQSAVSRAIVRAQRELVSDHINLVESQ